MGDVRKEGCYNITNNTQLKSRVEERMYRHDVQLFHLKHYLLKLTILGTNSHWTQ